jgi:hypothetical protein
VVACCSARLLLALLLLLLPVLVAPQTGLAQAILAGHHHHEDKTGYDWTLLYPTQPNPDAAAAAALARFQHSQPCSGEKEGDGGAAAQPVLAVAMAAKADPLLIVPLQLVKRDWHCCSEGWALDVES